MRHKENLVVIYSKKERVDDGDNYDLSKRGKPIEMESKL